MPAQLTISLKDTFSVSIDGCLVSLGGPRQQAVLSLLLLRRGVSATVDDLVDVIWEGRPPASATGTLHAYLARLRKILSPAGAVIVSDAAGYRIDLPSSAVDLWRFDDVLDQALTLDLPDDAARLVASVRPELEGWTGEMLSGPLRTGLWLQPVLARVTERHAAAVELLARAELQLGDTQSAVQRLEQSVQQHPLREGLVQALLVALYRSGRQADALEAYRRCGARLREDLGVDPSSILRDTHRAVLRHDPSLDWTPTPLAIAHSQLPARDPRFHGRTRELAQLSERVHRHCLVICTGLGGVGKTALAVELAHRHGGPVLWIPAETEPAIASRLQTLARQAGVRTNDQEDWLRRLWDLLSKVPNILVVFDNVDDPALLRSYRPDHWDIPTLVTSRHAAWGEVGVAVELDCLAPEEARAFLTARTASSDAVDELACELGFLPLALTQASAFIDQSGLSVSEYLRLFRDRRREMLAHGKPANYAATAASTWNLAIERVGATSAQVRQVLDVMAFLDPASIPITLLHGLFERPDPALEVAETIAELRRYSLIKRDGIGLSIHRLVQAAIRDSMEPARRREILHTAIYLLTCGPLGAPMRSPQGPEVDLGPLTTHVLAVAGHAIDNAVTSAPLVRLMQSCAAHMVRQGSPRAAAVVMREAVRIAQAAPLGPVALGAVHRDYATVLDAAGDLAEALHHSRRAIELLEAHLEPNDPVLAQARTGYAHVLNCGGHPAAAAAIHRQALTVLEQAGDPSVVDVLIDLGYAEWATHDLTAADTAFRRAQLLTEYPRTAQQRRRHAQATAGLGLVCQDAGQLDAAVALQQQALEELSALYGHRDHPDIAHQLEKFGYLLHLIGSLSAATQHHNDAVDMLVRCFGPDDPRVALALSNRGLTKHSIGDIDGAAADHRRAADLLRLAYGPQHPQTLLASDRLSHTQVTDKPTDARDRASLRAR